MIGILYIFHGSQKKEKNQAATSFIQSLQKKLNPTWVQKCAFLENHPDTIESMGKEMIAGGVDQLIAVPMLLFEAKHALIDIPVELKNIQDAFPKVKIVQTETFGEKENCRAILTERFKEQAEKYPNEMFIGFLVAHGTKRSKKPQAILADIAREIQDTVQFPIIATSLKGEEDYLAIIRKEASLTNRTPIFVPFFLFEGHLIDEMHEQLKSVVCEKLIITKTLEFDPRLLLDVEKIIRRAVR